MYIIIEDFYFCEVNTKYVSLSVLKVPMLSTYMMKYIVTGLDNVQ